MRKGLRKNKSSKVFVAMSGGVDSSVAAALLIEQGYKVIGCHIRCFNIDGCGERDADDARRVAEQLGIPFYVFDLEEEYKKRVVDYMVSGYRRGLTPNPDVMCNKEIKFGLFLERALKLGADFVATGHYVIVKDVWTSGVLEDTRCPNSRHCEPRPQSRAWQSLVIAKDKNKDQSYFLWTLTQNQLKHCLFPIGDYTKNEVRKLAKKFNLITAEKKDSQGICFLGKVTLVDFLKKYLPEKKGDVLDENGKKIGEHRGAHFYTIGQRHGFQIQNSKVKSQNHNSKSQTNLSPHYVVSKNIKNNTITVAENHQSVKEIILTDVNFINPKFQVPRRKRGSPKAASSKFQVLARIRYRQPIQKAQLLIFWICDNQKIIIRFDKPQKSIAIGQSAVFYNKDGTLLGGGVINL